MIRVAYKVAYNAVPPMIIQTDVTDPVATDWRTAKKLLRRWYLDEAAALRKISEKSYFNPFHRIPSFEGSNIGNPDDPI